MTQIHTAILGAMRMIAKTGIAKLSKNKDQGYNFRGIEAAMNEMSPILINNGITIVLLRDDADQPPCADRHARRQHNQRSSVE